MDQTRDLLERYARGEVEISKGDLDSLFWVANLEGANLEGGDFANVTVGPVDLTRSRLGGASLLGADLSHAKLERAYLAKAELARANLAGANLKGAILADANLEGANLNGADLEGACLAYARLNHATLESVDLGRAELACAELKETNLRRARLDGAQLDGAIIGSILIDLDLTPLCAAATRHELPSMVDYRSIVRSIHAPNLERFLVDAGMPQIFVDYMIECARTLSPTERFTLMLSTFISYGEPDKEFAARLNDALRENRVNTFFYPLDARLGEWNANVMHRGIREYDRVVVVCSESALSRKPVRNELNEARRKEAVNGGESCLIPIAIDGYVFSEEFKIADPDLAEFLLERVVGDFRGADKDEAVFNAMISRLAKALRRRIQAAAEAHEETRKYSRKRFTTR